MKLNRRRTILGLGGLCAAGGAAIGTGALTSVEATRTIDIDVEGDANAFVGLSAGSSSFVDDSSGALQIKMGDDSGGGGTGVNHGTTNNDVATTTIDPAFTLTNQGPDILYVRMSHSGVNGSGNDAQFVANDSTSSGTEGDVINSTDTSSQYAFIERAWSSGSPTAVITSVHSGGSTTTIDNAGYLQMDPGDSVDVILQIASDEATAENLIDTASIEAYSSESPFSSLSLIPS
ncbi:hypothetical protein [Halorientalis halophila]|uniref:hypothetical protein n=1 Tax=Halorientalis halophila TaxID=3108499 RepID=UPI00300A8F83